MKFYLCYIIKMHFSSLLWIFSFFFLATHSSAQVDQNKSFIPYTEGWFYIPGIDPALDECLVIELEQGDVLIELFAESAPLHVQRIKELAAKGSYDGVVFHRVIDGFMAQTGDVQYGNSATFNAGLVGTGSSDLEDLPSEFNTRSHLRGICSMARSSLPDSANSQFFICLADSTYLDQQYTVWGNVISGMEYVDQIKKGEGGNNGAVVDPDLMKKVYVRKLDQDRISGWMYTNKGVYPYFYDGYRSRWLYYDHSIGTPRFYDFDQKKWLTF